MGWGLEGVEAVVWSGGCGVEWRLWAVGSEVWAVGWWVWGGGWKVHVVCRVQGAECRVQDNRRISNVRTSVQAM